MATPIYNFFRSRPTEAWYQLSQEEKTSLMQKVEQSQTDSGGKLIVACRSRWSGEQWAFFGVSEYPDLESLQKDTERLEALDWYRYMIAETMLGVPWSTNATAE